MRFSKLYINIIFKWLLILSFFMNCIGIPGQNDFLFNLLIVKETPPNVYINYFEITDSTVVVNVSANNRINDSIFTDWINIDSKTYIHSNQGDYGLLKTNGIAISPDITKYTKTNQTITFNLFFPKFIPESTFDLIELAEGNWKFIDCSLYKPFHSDEISVYYAPHKYARLLYTYTESLMQKGEFEEATRINQYLLDFLKKNLITSCQLEATISYNLAGCYNRLQQDSLSLVYGNKVIKLYTNNLWTEDLALARTYGVLSDVYSRNEDYQTAIQMGEESLRIKQTLYPKGFSDLALTLGKLSSLYAQIEDFDNAIKRGEQAIVMRERLNGLDINSNLPIALNLCRYYYIQQRYAEALGLALSYYTDDVKKENLSAYIKLCGLISHSYKHLGNEILSRNYALNGYELLRKKIPNENRDLVNYLDALSLTEKLLIEETFIKSEHVDEFYLGVMQNLAEDYYEIGNLKNAIETQKHCLFLREANGIHNNVKECESWNRLLLYYLSADDSTNFVTIKDTCFYRTEDVFGQYSYEYANLLRISYLFYYCRGQYYEAFLDLTKSIEVYKYLIIRDFPAISYDDKEQLWRDFEDWFDQIYLDCHLYAIYSYPKRADILNGLLYNAILFSKGLLLNSQVANKAYEELVISHQDRINKRESISYILSEELYGTWRDVLGSLDSSSVAIEFIHNENTDEIISLTINPNENHYPIMDFLCSAKELDSLINNNAAPSEYNNLLWTNLVRHISNKENIYISLDGLLNTIPLENYLTDSHFVLPNARIVRVSSTRNLPQKEMASLDNCLLIGGLNYEDKGIAGLPNSEEEVREISELLTREGIKFAILTGNNGTKENLLHQLNTSFSTLHLATHAFYWEENSSKISKYTDVLVHNDSFGSLTDKRMCRSGIMLSSSNSKEQLLTSYDIAGLNLKNVSLVVLPNCKSGMGDVTNDGIIGLQRAFKEALVGTILMSLWDVDDLATKLFMVEFYRQCLYGEGIHDALKKAQIYLRNYTDGDGVKLFESPYYWAGFIILD